MTITRILSAAAGNLPALATLAYAAALFALSPDHYQRAVQEDEYIEWVTFWMFAAAGGANLLVARRERGANARLAWFSLGVAAFCFLVALEEISWGQRLLGYRPPPYFLEHNFQQELNVHNIMSDALRQFAFQAVVLGYGVLLRLAFIAPPIRRIGERIGIVPPPASLAPSFLATSVHYHTYPWTHSGEWAELMLATSMGVAAWSRVGVADGGRHVRRALGGPLARATLPWALVLLLGVGTSWGYRTLTRHVPERVLAARVELDALRKDVASPRSRTRCGTHKRVYSLMEKYDLGHLKGGAFAALTGRGLPEDRAQFFLDPWNSPYWVKHACSEDRRRRTIFVYSFGPNRLRDSTDWEIVEDDLGRYISRPESSSSE